LIPFVMFNVFSCAASLQSTDRNSREIRRLFYRDELEKSAQRALPDAYQPLAYTDFFWQAWLKTVITHKRVIELLAKKLVNQSH